MAGETHVIGTISELTVMRALLSNGWEVAQPTVAERYDLVAKDPETGDFKTLQIKTIKRRSDRNNAMVICSTDSRDTPYPPEECDYIVGVEGNNVYMVKNTGGKEYWATDQTADKRWQKLEIPT